MPNEYVWLVEENQRAQLVRLGSHFSTVRYTQGGIDYEVLIENDEFDIIEGDDGDTTED